MANFDLYYPKLKKHEGGYCSVEYAAIIGDKGGETYLGIARNFNPEWDGWAIIDEYKAKNGVPKWNSTIPDDRLPELAKALTKVKYWDALKCDLYASQSVAEYVMDFGYNSGIKTAAKALQRVIGVADDGQIGNKTLSALNAADQKAVFDKLVAYRVDFISMISTLRPDVIQGLIKRAKSFTFTS